MISHLLFQISPFFFFFFNYIPLSTYLPPSPWVSRWTADFAMTKISDKLLTHTGISAVRTWV